MESPPLRHFRDGRIFSDRVDVLVGEAWVQAVHTNTGWELIDGTRLKNIAEWRDGEESEQEAVKSRKSPARVQSRGIAQRQTRSRKGTRS